jgi:SAM-dependent methyltransferase
VEEPLSFEAASFDAVVLGEILEHVRRPEDVVSEALRVLRPAGVLVGSVPNAFRLQSRLLFLAGREPEDDPTHLHLYSPDAVRRLLAGFEQVTLEFVGGRYHRIHPRLLARDLVFIARRPA